MFTQVKKNFLSLAGSIRKSLILLRALEDSLSPNEKGALDRNMALIWAFFEKYRREKCAVTIFQEGTNGKRWRFSPQYDGEAFLRREVWSLVDLVSTVSVTPKLGGLLLKLVHRLQCGFVLEIGTAYGISSSYILQGLLLAGGGYLHTIEKMPQLALRINEMLSSFPLDRWTLFSGDALELLMTKNTPISKKYDLVFVDALHQKIFNVKLFNILLKIVNTNCVFVFDDIRQSPAMIETWQEIRKNSKVRFAREFNERFGILIVS